MLQRLAFAPVFLLLALYAFFMVSTNHRLTILDDEGTIIATANTPTPERVETFIHGTGQHLHPPLTDILLHEWLKLTHHSFAWLRVPAIFTYIVGLLLTARCGEILGNRRTLWIVLLVGTFWPFGYFYARVTGWYCFSFFLIAASTYYYHRLLQQVTASRWIMFTLAAIVLVWSNYYGLAVLLLLFADLFTYQRAFAKAHLVPLALSTAFVLLSFFPLVHDLLIGAHNTDAAATLTWPAAITKFGYMLFAMLASIAVAPWFLAWSLPVVAASVVLYLLLFSQSLSRRFAVYFFLLMLGLAATHTLDLKRLLFISPWFLLSIALRCSTGRKLQARAAVSALAVIFIIGWTAIANGKHRATSNFYEPWHAVAVSTAGDASNGSAIVSDSVSYFFYLDYALGINDSPSRGSYLGEVSYQRRGFSVFRAILPQGVSPASFTRVTTIRGIGAQPDIDNMAATMVQLAKVCRLSGSERFTPDPAAAYKKEIDPGAPSVEYRIIVDHFDCRSSSPQKPSTH